MNTSTNNGEYKTKLDLLHKSDSVELEKLLAAEDFPWYLSPIIAGPKKQLNNVQLSHSFYKNDSYNSRYKAVIDLFKDKINWVSLIRVKANLNFNTHKIIEHEMHTDFKNKKITTGVYYVNTNNGYTRFENGTIINSEKNKFIEFDSQQLHGGSTCTDKDYRIVINFNYIK